LLFGASLFGLSIYWAISGTIWEPRSIGITKKRDSPLNYSLGLIVYFACTLWLMEDSVCKIAAFVKK
jgi:hypothetical protein